MIFFATLAIALSCTVVEEAPVKPVREKTQAEQVEEVFLTVFDVLESRKIETFKDFLDFIINNVRVDAGEDYVEVSITENGRKVVSADVGIEGYSLVMPSVAIGDGRVRFEAAPSVAIVELALKLDEASESSDEADVLAVSEWFNSTYDVIFSLDGQYAGVLRMKPYEKQGRIAPAFVMDYADGTSCYIQVLQARRVQL